MKTYSFRVHVKGNIWYVNADGRDQSEAFGKAIDALLRDNPRLVYLYHELLKVR